MRYLILAALVAWTWTTPEGVQHWTDTQARVPSAYAAQAQRVEIGALHDFDRLTVDQTWRAPARQSSPSR